jgi:NDP-sugar pyrophosphorylase family protein
VLPTVCILAGGLGTRLGELTKNTPKPLLEVAGEPFLAHQIRLLGSHGASKIVLCVGYLGHMVEEAIGYEQEGIEISYSYDSEDLDGTLGALRRARHLLGEHFLVLYGDTYLQLDFADFAHKWELSGLPAAMTVLCTTGTEYLPNAVYRDNEIVFYDKLTQTKEMLWIDYGLEGLDASALDLVDEEVSDLADLAKIMSLHHQIFGYEVTERFYEIGTPEALVETDAMMRARSK